MFKKMFKLKNIITLFTIIFTSIAFATTANAGSSGKIVNLNQEPMTGVTVVFESDGDLGMQNRAVTDAMGNYVVYPRVEGWGTITVSYPGYRIIREKVWNSAKESRVYNYTLHQDWMGGKVVDRDNEPIAGVKITFEQDGGLTGIQVIFTDENGNYKYTVPKDAWYWLTFTKDGYRLLRDKRYIAAGQVLNATLQ